MVIYLKIFQIVWSILWSSFMETGCSEENSWILSFDLLDSMLIIIEPKFTGSNEDIFHFINLLYKILMMAKYNVCVFCPSHNMHCVFFFHKKNDNKKFFMEIFKRKIEVKTNKNEIYPSQPPSILFLIASYLHRPHLHGNMY